MYVSKMQQQSSGGFYPTIKTLSVLTTLLFFLGVHALASAQNSEHSLLLEEIVVTATKREASMQDLAISVTAFSGEQMQALGFVDSTNLMEHTPGLNYLDFGGAPSASTFSIRGVAQNDFADHQETPNAVYVDGAYISFLGGLGMALFDMERAEVLRGPQGTLFGRNATGGLVHLISRRPTEEFEAHANATYGSYDTIRFDGAVSGPLAESVAGRIALSTNHNDGYIDNDLTGEEVSETRNYSGRGQLLFTPGDDLEILLSVRASIDDDAKVGHYDSELAYADLATFDPSLSVSQSSSGFTDAAHQAFCLGFYFSVVTDGQDCFGFTQPDDDPYSVSNNAPGFFDREYYGATGTIEKKFDNFRIVSITDYQEIDKSYLEDSDSTPFTAGHFGTTQEADQVSQELRIEGETERLNWQAGFYYLSIDGDYFAEFDFTDSGAFTRSTYTSGTESYAFFGHTEYGLTDALTVTAGVRWTKDKKEAVVFPDGCVNTFPGFDLCSLVFGAASVQLVGFDGDREDDFVDFTVKLGWDMTVDTLLYASFSRGNKGGGFNASAAMLADTTVFSFEPEELNAFEVGIKSSFAEGRVRFNAGGYYYDYQDHQAFTFSRGGTAIINVDAEVAGFDAEMNWLPMDDLEILLGFAYNDAEGKDVPLGLGITRDQELGIAPEITFNGMIRKSWTVYNGMLSIQLEGSYVDDRFFSIVNKPLENIDNSFKTDLRIKYTDSSEQWSLTFFADNLFDEEIETYRFDETATNGTVLRGLARPQWFGGTLSYNWN